MPVLTVSLGFCGEIEVSPPLNVGVGSKALRVDLEPLLSGKEYRLVIPLRNSRDEEIVIRRVRSDCSCTNGELTPGVIEAGGTAVL